MLKTTKSQTINASSFVTENDIQVQVASMYASLDSKGNRSENVQIINQSLYELCKETVEADIAEFKEIAKELSNE